MSRSKRSSGLFSPTLALSIHDAAHSGDDAQLHSLSKGIMASLALDHIDLDELDAASLQDEWDGLPVVIPIANAVVSESSGALLVGDCFADLVLNGDHSHPITRGDCVGETATAYDLYLVRRGSRETFDAPGVVPGQRVELSAPKETGTFRLPAVAQPWEGKLVQVHKVGGAVDVYDMDGEVVECDGSAFADVAVDRGVWLAVLSGGGLLACDVLAMGYDQTRRLPLAERLSRLADVPSVETVVIDTRDKLWDLERRRWMIRWVDDGFSLDNPYWFRHDAQQIRPGQYVRPVVCAESTPTGDLVACRVEGGLRAQLHRDGDAVWIFRDGSAANLARLFPDIVEAAKELPTSSYVLCGELTGDLSASQIKRIMSNGSGLMGAELFFNAFDCVYMGGDDYHEVPCHIRTKVLRNSLVDSGLVRTAEFCAADDAPGVLLREKGGAYSLDGHAPDWHESRPDAPEVADEPPDLAVEGRRLSRLWIESDAGPVQQSDVAMPFVYHRRFDGVLTESEASIVLNRLLSGESVEGVYRLTVDLDELRVNYRETEWSRARRVVTRALEPVDGKLDLASLVVRATVSGDVRIQAPPEHDWLLGMNQAVVNEALQFLVRPGEIEEIGADSFSDSTDHAKWSSEQMDVQGSDWLERAVPQQQQKDRHIVRLIDRGSAMLGVQKHDFHEVFLLFESDVALSGRYIWSLVDVGGRGLWLGARPKDQTPYIIRRDLDEEVEKAREDKGWISWNPEGIRSISRTPLSGLLPMNWEERLTPFDDSPLVDFSA